MNPFRADDRVPENAPEDLNTQLNRIVTQLADRGVTLSQAREAFERQFIIASLRLNDGNLSRCAKALGIHRNTLRSKAESLRIHATDYRGSSKKT